MSTDRRVIELLDLRRKIDAELARLAVLTGAVDKPRRSRHNLPECGTESGYQRHRYYGEPQDELCRLAHNEHNRVRATLAAERKRAERMAELTRRAA